MNRIDALFKSKKKNILSVYFTAGFPDLNDTTRVLKLLENSGADLVEIGMPYSDPLADGEVIQQSGSAALKNGMNIQVLFQQLETIREEVKIPLVLMGYLNPVMQYGIEKFCAAANSVGVDGLILPDLTLDMYESQLKETFEKYNLRNVLLVTPKTSDERIQRIDALSSGFLYAVSASTTTGNAAANLNAQQQYFEKLNALTLKNPFLIGFGISNHQLFENACRYASGAIIGSAFIKHIAANPNLETSIPTFINSIIHDNSATK